MDKVRRPSTLSRMLTSPPATPRSSMDERKFPVVETQLPVSWQVLTPPSSIARSRSSSDLLSSPSQPIEMKPKFTEDGILECELDFNYNEEHVYGSGAWSTVYKATTCLHPTKISHGLFTPPSSPRLSASRIVAVKTGSRKDAIQIIRQEAKVLTHLRKIRYYDEHVGAFYGIIDGTSSIVLQGYSLSLEFYIKQCARTAVPQSTSPVVGNTQVWLSLASQLISSLHWLHVTAGIVHGDIKPANIMLNRLPHLDLDPVDELHSFPFQPLLIDFTSSQILDTPITPNTLSALTTEYAAPELLKASVLRDPMAHATAASDVFSLGVTLLVTVTGDTMVYGGYSAMQRQILATQGNSILSTLQSPRVRRQSLVWRTLERAFLKHDLGRISTGRWVELVASMETDLASQA